MIGPDPDGRSARMQLDSDAVKPRLSGSLCGLPVSGGPVAPAPPRRRPNTWGGSAHVFQEQRIAEPLVLQDRIQALPLALPARPLKLPGHRLKQVRGWGSRA